MSAPTTAPVLDAWGQRVYDRHAPWNIDEWVNGFPVAWLVKTEADGFADIVVLTEPRDDGTLGPAAASDPLTAPAFKLPELAARAGVDLTPGMTEAQQRQAITALDAASRGKPSAIIAAAQTASLDPAHPRLVHLVDDGAGTDQITVYESQTAVEDVPAIEAALERQVPFERQWVLTRAPGWTWSEMVAHYGSGTVWSGLPAEDWTTFSHHLPD